MGTKRSRTKSTPKQTPRAFKKTATGDRGRWKFPNAALVGDGTGIARLVPKWIALGDDGRAFVTMDEQADEAFRAVVDAARAIFHRQTADRMPSRGRERAAFACAFDVALRALVGDPVSRRRVRGWLAAEGFDRVDFIAMVERCGGDPVVLYHLLGQVRRDYAKAMRDRMPFDWIRELFALRGRKQLSPVGIAVRIALRGGMFGLPATEPTHPAFDRRVASETKAWDDARRPDRNSSAKSLDR